jgi:hypothetical protein
LFVVVFGVLDMGISFGDRWESTPIPTAQLGRLVSLWALWLVAAEIPAFARTLVRSAPRIAGNRAAGAISLALVTGGMTWVWTQVMPVLLRPVYVWSNLGDPARSAIMPVQLAGLAFAVAAGAVAGAAGWLRRIDGVTVAIDDLDVRRPPAPPWLAAAKQLAMAALLTLALGGLVSTTLDAVVLFVAFAVGGPLATMLATRTPMGGLLDRVPLLGRAMLAALLTFGAGLVLVGRLEDLGGPSEFFSVIAVTALGYLLARLVLAPGHREPARQGASSPAAVGIVASSILLAAGLVGLGAAAPATVLADNCASFADCWSVPFLGALVGGGLPLLAAFAMSWSPWPPPKDPFGPVPPISLWNYPKWVPPPPDKRWAEEQKRKWQEYAKQKRDFLDKKEDDYRKNQYPQMSPAARRAHDRYMKQQRDYYSQPDPPQMLSNSAKPIDAKSFPSSGAGSKF